MAASLGCSKQKNASENLRTWKIPKGSMNNMARLKSQSGNGWQGKKAPVRSTLPPQGRQSPVFWYLLQELKERTERR